MPLWRERGGTGRCEHRTLMLPTSLWLPLTGGFPCHQAWECERLTPQTVPCRTLALPGLPHRILFMVSTGLCPHPLFQPPDFQLKRVISVNIPVERLPPAAGARSTETAADSGLPGAGRMSETPVAAPWHFQGTPGPGADFCGTCLPFPSEKGRDCVLGTDAQPAGMA